MEMFKSGSYDSGHPVSSNPRVSRPCFGGPGKKLLGHVDPMEEIYYIQNSQGGMQVGNEICEVEPGDAVESGLAKER